MNIVKFAYWTKLIFRLAILIAVLYWAIGAYGRFRLQKEGELCANWGAGDQASSSALVRAKGRAECIQNHAGFVERLYFHSINDMMSSLPNAPCKYVGVWTRTAPGNVYKFLLDDAGNFTAVRMDGRDGGADRYVGNWAYWKGSLVWFTGDGQQWPPDANAILSEDADRLTLRERDGSQSQFTRLNSVDSKLCGTSGVSPLLLAAKTNDGANTDANGDTSVDTSKLLPQRVQAPPLDQWAGQYVADATLDGDATATLAVAADGQVSGNLQCVAKAETGTLQAVDDWYELAAVSVNANDACRLATRFYPLEWGSQHYLLSDPALTYVVNQINAGQAVDTHHLLKRTGGAATASWPVDKRPVLPKPYNDGMLKTPLQASATDFGTVGATSPAELLQPHPNGVEYGANATINVGSRAYVFVGMQFHAPQAPDSLRIVVTKALLESASVRLTWRGDWRPPQTLSVSTKP